ncbi:hypothetical protein Pmani_034779 [Petrolisthes manimaculis]|uniref:Uncharacterized protein n=1 Tax=Petrolisthes manimaculis TaxID=1843537 RepID=A0AAE1TNT6_9EUCA|nr:hypothetical protein Pmani_034779 [Petrolisthes manimaculis]
MSGPAPVTFGSLTGADIAPSPSSLHYLPTTYTQIQHQGHDTEHEDIYSEEVEGDLDENMTADSGGLRAASSPQDCSINRKSNKPMMEKKRRQRINRSLNDLKALLLEAAKKDPSRYSRLEKADILEMTVRHIQMLHRQESKANGGRNGRGEESKYRAGFSHCASEVTRYLGDYGEVPRDLLAKLTAHLDAMSTSLTNTVNNTSRNTCVQNSVNVTASPMPIILVLNTAQPTGPTLASQVQGGTSLGVQPLTLVTTSRAPQLLPQMAGGDVTVVMPPVGATPRLSPRDLPSRDLQAQAPVLSSILTSELGRPVAAVAGRVVQPPALSTSSVDSALGPDTPEMFDSDISCSGPSTPMSSLDSADSPSPLEDPTHSSPKRSALSSSSPSQAWNSNYFREELGHCQARPTPTPSYRRGTPTLAPKPTHTPKTQNNSPSHAPADTQCMWRPWH